MDILNIATGKKSKVYNHLTQRKEKNFSLNDPYIVTSIRKVFIWKLKQLKKDNQIKNKVTKGDKNNKGKKTKTLIKRGKNSKNLTINFN